MSSKEVILGIDLGTTNSLVAVADSSSARVIRDGDSALIPSVLIFDEFGKIQAVGQRAKTLKAIDPKNVIYSVKRLMGKGKSDLQNLPFQFPFDLSESTDALVKIKVGNRSYTPIELSAEILKRCKTVAENDLGHAIKKAVITVPAYFNDSERSATAMAGQLAGLEVVRIINEPTAAALAYGAGRAGESSKIAIYDFGGGTFDISFLKVTDGIFEVLSTAGNTQLGGDDLDDAIAKYFMAKMGKAPQSEEGKILFLTQVEYLKKSLSDCEELNASFHWDGEIQWVGKVTRLEIEEVVRPILEKTIDCCRSALNAANLKVENLDRVILVGGSTRMQLVKARVGSFFKRIPDASLNPDEVVALGAAIQGSILSGALKDTLLLDVVPLSLGLETMGGVISKIISRNSTIPTAASEMFTTYADNQTAVDLHILQGERELAKDCRSLGRFKLRIPPGPAGLPKIQVIFLMDANGMLQVQARDERTDQQASFEVKPSFGLTDVEVEEMLRAAWENAQIDLRERQLVEARNQAEMLLRATKRSLENPVLEPDFKMQQTLILQPLISALQEDIRSAALEVLLVRTKELDLATRALAESILDRSIQARLSNQSLDQVQV